MYRKMLSFLLCGTLFCQAPRQTIIPKATWEPIFFQSINEICKQINIEPLRSKKLERNDLEIRIWIGFGIISMNAYILSRESNQWHAIKIGADPTKQPIKYITKSLDKDHNFHALWNHLDANGFFNIKDSSELPQKTIVDGECYVVEFVKNDIYRTYMIDNPDIRTSSEERSFLKLMQYFENHLK